MGLFNYVYDMFKKEYDMYSIYFPCVMNNNDRPRARDKRCLFNLFTHLLMQSV